MAFFSSSSFISTIFSQIPGSLISCDNKNIILLFTISFSPSSEINSSNPNSDFSSETNLKFKITNNKGKEVDIGSICSGGQYNKLISRFKGVDIPGTGFSVGVDRLLFAILQLGQIDSDIKKPAIVCVMDKKYLKNYYEILKILRDNGINSEIFLDSEKNLGKQLTYANKRGCPVAVICGENEFKENTITLKNKESLKSVISQLSNVFGK